MGQGGNFGECPFRWVIAEKELPKERKTRKIQENAGPPVLGSRVLEERCGRCVKAKGQRDKRWAIHTGHSLNQDSGPFTYLPGLPHVILLKEDSTAKRARKQCSGGNRG